MNIFSISALKGFGYNSSYVKNFRSSWLAIYHYWDLMGLNVAAQKISNRDSTFLPIGKSKGLRRL